MELVFETRVDAPRERVFAFHADPANLALLMRDRRSFQLLRHDGSVRVGSETWVRERGPFGLGIVLGFRHVLHEPPERFGEECVHGPFRRFLHVHEFEPAGAGRTLVRDRLEVELPLVYGGAAAERLLLPRWMRSYFSGRHRELARLVREGAFEDGAR